MLHNYLSSYPETSGAHYAVGINTPTDISQAKDKKVLRELRKLKRQGMLDGFVLAQLQDEWGEQVRVRLTITEAVDFAVGLTWKILELLHARKARTFHNCVNCEGVGLVASEGWLKQVIPAQPDEHKCVQVNSPHWKCPKCGFAALREGQGDELRRRVNLAVFGVYKPLVTNVPFLPPVAEYLRSNSRKSFIFRFANPPESVGQEIGEQVRTKANKYRAKKRAKQLKRGMALIKSGRGRKQLKQLANLPVDQLERAAHELESGEPT
jgi:hypothetical protein